MADNTAARTLHLMAVISVAASTVAVAEMEAVETAEEDID